MKVLKAGIDFSRASNINPALGDTFLIKQAIATGWGKLARVTRITKTQVELEVINVIPTEETNKFGTKNGMNDRFDGFFHDWAFRKKVQAGKKFKFFRDNGISVGDTDSWNPTVLCEFNNS
jgi:hypothetical protein